MKRSFSSRNDSTLMKYKRRCVNAIRDFPFRRGSVNQSNPNNVYLSDVEENEKECPVNESVPFSPDLELIEYPDYLALEDDDAKSCSGSCSSSGHSAGYTPSKPEFVRYSDHFVLVDDQVGVNEFIGILGVSKAGAIRFHSSGPEHKVKAIKRRGIRVTRDFPPGCGPINHSNSKIYLSDVEEEEEEFPDYLQLEPELVGLPDYIPLEDDQDCNFITMNEAGDDLIHLETSEKRKVIVVTDEAESSSVASCSWGSFSDPDDDYTFRLAASEEEVTSAPPINRLSSTTMLSSGCFGFWWN